MKRKQPCSDFELGSLTPFPNTITVMENIAVRRSKREQNEKVRCQNWSRDHRHSSHRYNDLSMCEEHFQLTHQWKTRLCPLPGSKTVQRFLKVVILWPVTVHWPLAVFRQTLTLNKRTIRRVDRSSFLFSAWGHFTSAGHSTDTGLHSTTYLAHHLWLSHSATVFLLWITLFPGPQTSNIFFNYP